MTDHQNPQDDTATAASLDRDSGAASTVLRDSGAGIPSNVPAGSGAREVARKRQLEVERLTALFAHAILHTAMPSLNPNQVRWAEAQARSCALAVVDELAPQAPAEPRTAVDEALAAWEAHGPTSLTVALLADALYGVREAACRHCGALPEADGDHSCPCPYSDEDCQTHPAAPSVRPATADDEGVRRG